MVSSRYLYDVGEAACLKLIRLSTVTSVNVTGDVAGGAARGDFVCRLKPAVALSSKKRERAQQLAASNDRGLCLSLLAIRDQWLRDGLQPGFVCPDVS